MAGQRSYHAVGVATRGFVNAKDFLLEMAGGLVIIEEEFY